MTQHYEEMIYLLEYPERIEKEGLESLEIEKFEEQPKTQEKSSRKSLMLEKLAKKARFNNRYFETLHSVDNNKQQAILRAKGYFKF